MTTVSNMPSGSGAFPKTEDPDGLFPLNPDEIDQIERSNALAQTDTALPTLDVWPRFRDHDHMHLTGRCPRCSRPRGFGLTSVPWRRACCPCGGADVRLIVHMQPVPTDLEYEVAHEPDDLAMMAEILRPHASYTQRMASLDAARSPLRKHKRVSHGSFLAATEAIARTGIFGERHAIQVESGATPKRAMRSLLAAFIQGQRGRTMRVRLWRALNDARAMTARGASV